MSLVAAALIALIVYLLVGHPLLCVLLFVVLLCVAWPARGYVPRRGPRA